MLLSISINKILLIDSCCVELHSGFNIISGETGSGKSIILDCISFALGQKVANLIPRKGSSKGSITLTFDIENNSKVEKFLESNDIEIPEDGTLIIRKTISDSSRSISFINDNQVSNKILKDLGLFLTEIYGQHDSSNLLDSKEHINILDEFASLNSKLNEISEIYNNYRKVENDLKNIKQEAQRASAEEEYLRFVLNEIESADIKQGEETELVEKRNILKNSQKIIDSIKSVLSQIEDQGLLSNLYSSQKTLNKLTSEIEGNLGDRISKICDSFEKAAIELEDSSSDLNSILMEAGYGEDNLDEVEERLYAIRELARKYRKNPDELEAYSQEIKNKLELIDSFEEKLNELTNLKRIIKDKYENVASLISQKRKESAKNLEDRIHKEFPSLNMQGCKFKVSIDSNKDTENFTAKGYDKVKFVAATNAGQEFTEISKTASGGELSRIMLAMKLALSEKVGASTVIFDEIDTGIGGATAEAVGLRLKKLSENIQLICITHQPQVASKNDRHFNVSKTQTSDEIPVTDINELTDQQSNEEIARMLSGIDITEEARAAAKKLKVS